MDDSTLESSFLREDGKTVVPIGNEIKAIENNSYFEVFDEASGDIELSWANAPNLKRYISTRFDRAPKAVSARILDETTEFLTTKVTSALALFSMMIRR